MKSKKPIDQLIQAEAALAASYQKQVPGLSRSEALRLAAKHLAKDIAIVGDKAVIL